MAEAYPTPSVLRERVVTVSEQVVVTTTTVTNGTAVSGVIDCGDARMARIDIPAAWTAANLTVQVSSDGVNFNNFYDASGNEYTLTVGGVSRSVLVPYSDFVSVRFLKLRSGTSGTPVNQAADRVLTLTLAP